MNQNIERIADNCMHVEHADGGHANSDILCDVRRDLAELPSVKLHR